MVKSHDVDQSHGKIVYQCNECNVRIKYHEEGEKLLSIFIHKVVDGHERLPRGYVYGANFLDVERN